MKSLRFWIGMCISVAALAVLAYQVDVEEVLESFREASYIWLAPALFFAIASLASRAARWRTLFLPLKLPVPQLFGLMLVGYTVNTLLPLRAGDVARAHLIGQVHHESRVRAFTTIVVEHLLDAVVITVILLALTPFVTFPQWAVNAGWVAIPAMVVIGIGIAWFWRRRSSASETLAPILGTLPLVEEDSVREKIESAVEGFSALRDRRATVWALIWSAVTWLSGGMMMWSVLVAFDLPHSFPYAMFLVAMSAVALAIPSSPGFVGVYHVLIVEALVLVLAVGAGEATGFALVTHVLLFVPPVVLGIGYMVFRPHVWNDLLHWRQQHEDQPAD